MEMQIVVTRDKILGPLANRFGVRWTHAALLFRSEPNVVWQVIESTIGGVRVSTMARLLHSVAAYACYAPVQPLGETRTLMAWAYAMGNVGKPYYYWGFICVLLRELFRRALCPRFSLLVAREYICSDFVKDVCDFIDFRLVDNRRLVLPDDLVASDKLMLMCWRKLKASNCR